MHFKGTFFWVIFTSLLVAFICLSVFIAHHPIIQSDIAISNYLQQYHANWLDKVMTGISFFGELPYSLISVLLAAAIFYVTRYRREAYYTASILLSGLIILLVKQLVDRPRPTSLYVRLVGVNRFQSFPSGHVLSYTLFFGFLLILMFTLKGVPNLIKNVLIFVSTFYIVTIPFSRIYLGAHWFTDVLGGFLLGLCLLFPLCYFYFRGKDKSEIERSSILKN
ncbi:membrane-associated phospholipid phosphatase [Pedobacter sp. UYP30]|uniref:phosphatase PAP2 family protein n=1 Tax=Pedobacter sp. UYP30 TaxID=1756400 RepID=UPI003395B3F9